MVPLGRLASLGIVAVGLVGAPALAQTIEPGREGALGEIVPPIHLRSVCLARTYDAAHLKAHPRQKVAAMTFRLRYYKHEPDKSFPAGQRNYYFDLSASLRGRAKRLQASGECGTVPGQIVCGVECDGGGFSLKREASGTLLLDLTHYGRIRMSRGCDDEAGIELTEGQDDKRFRLERVDAALCREFDG